jgi:hypothetical protein
LYHLSFRILHLASCISQLASRNLHLATCIFHEYFSETQFQFEEPERRSTLLIHYSFHLLSISIADIWYHLWTAFHFQFLIFNSVFGFQFSVFNFQFSIYNSVFNFQFLIQFQIIHNLYYVIFHSSFFSQGLLHH